MKQETHLLEGLSIWIEAIVPERLALQILIIIFASNFSPKYKVVPVKPSYPSSRYLDLPMLLHGWAQIPVSFVEQRVTAGGQGGRLISGSNCSFIIHWTFINSYNYEEQIKLD